MKQRYELTEEEHKKLVSVGNTFWTKLSKITAEAINKMPKELETLTIDYLQDHASLYGSDYDQYLDENRP